MSNNEVKEKICQDIRARGLSVSGFICVDDGGNKQILSYDDKGCIVYLSEKINNTIVINERLRGNVVSPICEIKASNK